MSDTPTPSRRWRIALIGAGAMGANHARTVANMPDARLVAVVDPDRARADALAIAHGAVALDRLDPIRGALDAVILAAPSTLHAAMGLDLIAARLPCVIEKPLALTVEDAARMGAAVGDLPVAVGHVERFNPAFTVARARLAGRRIAAVDAFRLAPPVGRATDADVVADLMLHDLDAVSLLLPGMPEAVATAWDHDHATTQFHWAGVPCRFAASRRWPERVRRLDILLEGGNLVSLDWLHRRVVELAPDGTRIEQAPPADAPLPLTAQFGAFLGWLAGDGPGSSTTVADAARTLELVRRVQTAS
jgi:predicted dehydrogenase